MRFLAVTAIVWFAVQSGPAHAEEARQPKTARSPAIAASSKPAIEMVDPGKQAQGRMDAQQAAWDKKMKAVGGSICRGC
jgi:hypothetical protein